MRCLLLPEAFEGIRVGEATPVKGGEDLVVQG